MTSPQQVKNRLSEQGKTIAEAARELGVSPTAAYRVLSGYDKGLRGEAFRAARAFGLKPFPPIQDTNMHTATTIYRAHITLGNLIVPACPTGNLWALDELADYYHRNQAAEVMRAKVLLRLGIHHTDADSVRVAEILTHAELHERGQSPIAPHRWLEVTQAPAGPRYIAPQQMLCLFDDARTGCMVSQMHAGVMVEEVERRIRFRALVVPDDADHHTWMVLIGAEHYPTSTDTDAVFEALPNLLGSALQRAPEGLHVVEVQELEEVRYRSRIESCPLAYLFEEGRNLRLPYLWPEALMQYRLISDDLAGYLTVVRASLGLMNGGEVGR